MSPFVRCVTQQAKGLWRRYLKASGLLVIIVTMIGCQSTTSGQLPPRQVDQADPQSLMQGIDQENLSEAVELTLTAAEMLITQGNFDQALNYLNQLQLNDSSEYLLSKSLYERYLLTLAQTQFKLGQLQDSQATLNKLTSWSAPRYMLQGQVCEMLRQFRCAADAYILASTYDFSQADVDKIWLLLERSNNPPQIFSNREHEGWWQLSQLMSSAETIGAKQVAWQRWQSQHPRHPANLHPPQVIEKLHQYKPPNLAFFLPLSGPYSAVGTAVRDGAIAAYFQEPTQLQPRLHFYDTHNTQLGALWEQALTDNIDITVGPLLKPNVEAFRKLTAQSVQPRLLLNFTNDGQTISGEYQIGIAIEEEARAIIDSLLFSGFSRLLVVESEARWANRVLLQLQKLWPHKIAHAQFSDIRTITQAVGQAMAVSASQQRHTQLQQIIGEQLEFLPRARKDVDAIVTLTNQVETQALIPALKFHFADSLPVYATSQAARGAQTPQLDGIRLTEMPMFAQPSPSQQSLDQAFELNTHPQAELLGLGFDAAKLALHLAMHVEGQSLVIPGATGLLWLDPQNRVKRDVNLYQFQNNGTYNPIDNPY